MPAAPGPKSFLMSEVKAKMGRYASTNFFHVFFTVPPTVKNNVDAYGGGRYLNFIDIACIDATLPGSTFATHEATNDYTGITERHVYRRQFDGKIDFTFAIDREYTLIKLFEGWMGYIGGEASDGYKNYEANSAYRVPFLNEYVCDLTLVKYEKDATIVENGYSPTRLEYHFVNAFPISISSMPISQGPTDLLTMTVTMDYQKYWITEINGKSGKGATGSGGPQGAKQVPNSAYNDSNNYQLNTDKVPDYESPELQGGTDRNQYGNQDKVGDKVTDPEILRMIDEEKNINKPVQPNNDQPQISSKRPKLNPDSSYQPPVTEEEKARVEKERRVAKEGIDFY